MVSLPPLPSLDLKVTETVSPLLPPWLGFCPPSFGKVTSLLTR